MKEFVATHTNSVLDHDNQFAVGERLYRLGDSKNYAGYGLYVNARGVEQFVSDSNVEVI